MERKFYFAYGAAALFLGSMAFSACSSSEDIAEGDATEAPVNPTYNGESVKTAFAINIPRANAKTRMSETNTQATGNFLGMYEMTLMPFTGTPTGKVNQIIGLADIATGITVSASSKIYKNVTIPVGTTNFLFYGHAPETDNAETGKLSTNVTSAANVEGITFDLVKVLNGTASTTQSEALLGVLNGVAGVADWKSSSNTSLAALYDEFIKLKAGSANSILYALQRLYTAADVLKDDATVGTVATKIMRKITEGGVFTADGTGTLSTTNNYPADKNLPDGAVAVKFDDVQNKFSYVATSGVTVDMIDAAQIYYPSSIYYYANTPLKASNNEVADSDWPKTTTNWDAAFTGTDWGEAVLASTRSIALKNNINYGVANLKLSASCASSVLLDKEFTDSEGVKSQNSVGVPTGGFPISAVFIGSQPKKVGYDFISTGDQAADFEATIYDSKVNIVADYNAAPTYNYTLVLPTEELPNAQKVNFALELTNNSTVDFRGKDDQIIPVGSKFYLIGTLDATEGGNIKDNPNTLDKVFASDYQTTATVKISSLANAYNVIPDLRATNIKLGLSVDLVWEAGISFYVNIE